MADTYEWERRLRSAEPVWLYRFPGSYIAAIFTTLIASLFLSPTIRFISLTVTGHWSILVRNYGPLALVLPLLAVGVSFYAVLMWRLVLLAHITMTSSYLEYTDTWGKSKRVNLSDIRAATINTYYPRKGSGKHVLQVQQSVPGFPDSPCWINITGRFFGVKIEIAEVILQEIIRGCALTTTR